MCNWHVDANLRAEQRTSGMEAAPASSVDPTAYTPGFPRPWLDLYYLLGGVLGLWALGQLASADPNGPGLPVWPAFSDNAPVLAVYPTWIACGQSIPSSRARSAAERAMAVPLGSAEVLAQETMWAKTDAGEREQAPHDWNASQGLQHRMRIFYFTRAEQRISIGKLAITSTPRELIRAIAAAYAVDTSLHWSVREPQVAFQASERKMWGNRDPSAFGF